MVSILPHLHLANQAELWSGNEQYFSGYMPHMDKSESKLHKGALQMAKKYTGDARETLELKLWTALKENSSKISSMGRMSTKISSMRTTKLQSMPRH